MPCGREDHQISASINLQGLIRQLLHKVFPDMIFSKKTTNETDEVHPSMLKQEKFLFS